MQISEAAGGAPEAGAEPCRFPKLEECAHFHYERVQLPPLVVTLQTNMDQSLHSQHTNDNDEEYYMVQVTSGEECWLLQRNIENFKLLDAQLHQCIYDRKISQLPDLSSQSSYNSDDIEMALKLYLEKLCSIVNNSLNCGPVLNWLQMDNKGHRLLVPSEESRSINTPAVAAAYSIRRYVSQARDELNLEVGDMISVIDMANPSESMWWRGKRGFQVGFFPQHCVHIIGDKVPRNMPLPPPVVGSLALSPIKPVLRKHGKLIAFFRSFILNRPSRRRLKQSGILKERVFGCDLGEHLLNSGHDIPMVLKCCAEFIEKNGIVDGIYRLSGVTSNIQKLRNAFDEDRIPNLYTEEILQDIHSVASLLKMYFRELPNPLCTYQLYQSFVNAVQGCNPSTRNSDTDREKLLKMREAVQKLPPPHYRTLEYLMRHLAKVAKHGSRTGMTTRNVAIVWAPNLLRSEELEGGGVAALQGVGVQAVVTEFLICYTDLIFCDHLPMLENTQINSELVPSPKRSRPKSLAISTPTKLITLEEARTKHQITKGEECGYIEVGGGPKNLPKKYHTILELPSGRKRHSSGWRSFFSKSRNSSQNTLAKSRKASTPGIIVAEKCITESNLADIKRKLRTVKSAESLTSGISEVPNNEIDGLGPLQTLNKPPGHNRSVSHDSYFDMLQNSQNNSEGSLLDLSEIQLNFDLEESEMRIFSEDESLVSSPRIQKDGYRKYLARTRPEDYGSTANSTNPSPKKQPRVIMSPDSMSRKRTRLEDQLSDIQYIDCNTPDNPITISTTAVVHQLPESKIPDERLAESYQPKNKSPRNSQVENKRQSLNLEECKKPVGIPKSLTEVNIGDKLIVLTQSSTFASPTPQSPIYKPLNDSSTATTPGDLSPPTEIYYHMLNKYAVTEDNRKTDTSIYENFVPSPLKPKASPTYENVLTTISITYKSPTKRFSNSSLSVSNTDSIYEDVTKNIEKAVIPTEPAVLPTQEANQPEINEMNSSTSNDQRPKSLSALEELKGKHNNYMKTNLSTSAVCNSRSEARTISTNNGTLCKSSETTLNSSVSSDFANTSNTSSTSAAPYHFIENNELSPTDLSLSEIVQTSSENLSANQYSCPATPTQNSLSPNVSPTHGLGSHEISHELLSTNDTSKTRNTSESSLIDEKTSENSDQNAISKPNSLELDDIIRPASVNLIHFSPNETENRMDKRKSSETIDDNSIYQQVKYFRRSVHEINALLDLKNKTKDVLDSPDDNCRYNVSRKGDSIDFDSLENEVHIYENVDHSKISPITQTQQQIIEEGQDACEKVDVKSLTNIFEYKEKSPQSSKKISNYENYNVKNKPATSSKIDKNGDDITQRSRGNSFTEKICNLVEEKSKEIEYNKRTYDRDSLPPCVRLRNLKHTIKTRSLDEQEFNKECGSSQSLRRKSLDENLGYNVNNPKILNPPKELPSDEGKLHIHLSHSIGLLNEQKLNRERIEKYKEERRKELNERFRSESFKEDKDILLLRLKLKPRDDEVRKSIRMDSTRRKTEEERRKNSFNESEESEKGDELSCDSLEVEMNNAVIQNKVEHPKETQRKCENVNLKSIAAKFEQQNKQEDFKRHETVPSSKDHSKKHDLLKLANRSKIFCNDDAESDMIKDTLLMDELLRNRRKDELGKSGRRRHTSNEFRERENDADRNRRVSLEPKSPRKEKTSPSLCIKDMKAIFEPKSQQ